MLALNGGKLAVAALGTLLAGTGLGLAPVARFVAPLRPTRPPRHPYYPERPPQAPLASHGTGRAGPISFEAMLSQSRVSTNGDGTVFVDVKLTADTVSGENQRRPIDFALVLDVSGSMADANKIGLMQKACLDLGSRLSNDDRIALVAFSTGARTVLPLASLDRAAYERAIRELIPQGGTNISEGLELGAAELARSVRPGAARRIVLLTDGQPNAGDSTPEGLAGVAKRLEKQGVSVTTVGLGLDYNARLLSDMAEVGGGSYHYVDSAERIAKIYESEIASLRSLVARGVTVTLEPVRGGRVADVIEWTEERLSNGAVAVHAGDFESGRSTKIVARLALRGPAVGGAAGGPEGAAPRASSGGIVSGEALRVRVNVQDARGVVHSSAPVSLGVEATASDDLALASATPAAKKDVEDAQVGDLIERARQRAEKGDTAGARKCFEELKAKRATVSYEARDGKKETMTVDEMQRAYESDDAEQRARALYFSRSAAGSAAK